jgi:orotidine 5'-phosphate decarboxylase subfamily 1
MSGLSIHPLSKQLFQIMEIKQSNLSLSADVTSAQELLKLAQDLGPSLCVLKTHIDIMEDFTPDVSRQLLALSKEHQFLIFEDRKFADIGNTVVKQYEGGIYRISDWAHMTNAHPLPGNGIVEGLRQVGLPKGRGLLLLAEMSSKNHLMTSDYTQKTIEMALRYPDFVMGFICQRKISDHPGHIHMMPGIQFAAKGDALGQQYATPEEAILERHVDIIIVGRGVIAADDPKQTAERYRKVSWDAFQQRALTKGRSVHFLQTPCRK